MNTQAQEVIDILKALPEKSGQKLRIEGLEPIWVFNWFLNDDTIELTEFGNIISILLKRKHWDRIRLIQ